MTKEEEQKQRELPEVAVELEGHAYWYFYVCGECHGQVDWNVKECPYCHRRLNWNE